VKVAGAERMRAYYLINLIGNPLDTSIAAACLVFGGVLDRHPSLKICLSHGGGFIPYQAGRLAHGWSVRHEPKAQLPASPEASLRRFYYDCILHSPAALRYLVDAVGATHVLLGSDYPFDMGMYDAVTQIQSLGISEADRATILGGQAQVLLNVPVREAAR
jgi:aminocarboxymuconate-semialdehyde decarboxylase